jgi:hypothetical protein
MKFKNYCVVIMGDTQDAVGEIEKISESKPNILDCKGILISTFTSFVDVKEITAWFTFNNRNFLVFELDDDTSGYFITRKDIHKGLFGFLDKEDDSLDWKTMELLRNMYTNKDDLPVKGKGKETKKTINESDIEKMSKAEKQELLDKLIENGVENLSDHDKKILPLLAK